ncbi:hypothetical protein IWQ60_004261 [Tieghemiomyces parasiticus]|uniref:HSF-type DNA-binding domain-containing protein n=1 Tax=Tieghemiomyces parasiticus TaxID=78921 RepID=A0A9W8AG49_9FUNG|nr:hypothetical protein IWQ60_004261 [Tieghemiomyces parasiticus]
MNIPNYNQLQPPSPNSPYSRSPSNQLTPEQQFMSAMLLQQQQQQLALNLQQQQQQQQGLTLQQPQPTQQQQHLQLQGLPVERRSSSPTSPSGRTSNTNTFVHKLHDMVNDPTWQHLITWSPQGTSFIVCDINRLAQDVLSKHFKHSNFQSFVRQLNMYGFHKINKSPRGNRPSAENQIWEFSHPRFRRGHPELLDEIKRKALDSDTSRRETGDLSGNVAMVTERHEGLERHVRALSDYCANMNRELQELRLRQAAQQESQRRLVDFLRRSGVALPDDVLVGGSNAAETAGRTDAGATDRPQILVTNHDMSLNVMQGLDLSSYNLSGFSSPTGEHSPLSGSFPTPNLGVQFDPNSLALAMSGSPIHSRPVSPNTFMNLNHAANTPLPPSPMIHGVPSDDDMEIMSQILSSSRPGSFHGSD